VCRPASDVWQHEEDPDVNQKNEEDVKEEFANHLFAQVQSTINDD